MERSEICRRALIAMLPLLVCAGCASAPSAQETPSPVPPAASVAPSAAQQTAESPIGAEGEVDPEVEAQEQNRKNMWIEIAGFEEEEGAVWLGSAEGENGERTERYLYEDLIQVSIERVEPIEYGEEAIRSRTAQWEGISEDDIDMEMDEQSSYPAFRIFYLTGDMWNIDLYMQTDLWDFRIHTALPVDIEGMDEDEEYNYIEQTIIRWFYNVEIIDIAEERI